MGIGTAIAFAAIEGGSALMKGNEANKQAKRNAQIDLVDAEVKIDEARERAAIRRRNAIRASKSERVAAAASGFTQEGTSLQLQLDQIKAGELAAREEIRVGRTEERRLQKSALNNLRRGRAARTQSFFEAGSAAVGAFV